MKKTVFTLLAVILQTAAIAQESRTEYNFLRLPVSAHAAALGSESVTLVDDDESLIFGNPALLCNVSDKSLLLNYMTYMEGSNTLSAAFNRVLGEKAAVAVAAQYFNYGEMKEVDENNNIKGDFSAKDISINGYFSYVLANNLTGGIAAKVITSYIGDYNAMAMGVDLGLNYADSESGWSLGVAVKNLGGQLDAFDDNYEKMPVDVVAGVTKQLPHTPFRFSFTMSDLNHLDYKFKNHVAAGVDILLSETIWVGGGYNFRRAEEMSMGEGDEESSHGAGLSFGAGINLNRFKLNMAYGKYHVSSSSLLINASFVF